MKVVEAQKAAPAETESKNLQDNKEEDEKAEEKNDETLKLPEDLNPAEVLGQMRQSNLRDIIMTMTAHEQLRLLRNLLEDEEFKRRQRQQEKQT